MLYEMLNGIVVPFARECELNSFSGRRRFGPITTQICMSGCCRMSCSSLIIEVLIRIRRG